MWSWIVMWTCYYSECDSWWVHGPNLAPFCQFVLLNWSLGCFFDFRVLESSFFLILRANIWVLLSYLGGMCCCFSYGLWILQRWIMTMGNYCNYLVLHPCGIWWMIWDKDIASEIHEEIVRWSRRVWQQKQFSCEGPEGKLMDLTQPNQVIWVQLGFHL